MNSTPHHSTPDYSYAQRSVAKRDLPLSVPLAALFGGFINQFGWLFFGFGMIFVWVFAQNADWSFITWRTGTVLETEGVVTDVVQTSMSEGGSDNTPGRPIHEFTFSYEIGGAPYLAQSYSSTKYVGQGENIEVEYLEGSPEKARIKGMRTAAFGPFVAFVFIFPLVGLGFILFGIKRGLKTMALCKEGVLATGKVVAKERTNTRINKRTVYQLTIEFQDMYGTVQQFHERTHKPELLEDDGEEQLLYLPKDPSFASALDVLPARPEVHPDGSLTLSNSSSVILYLIIPGLSILGHGSYALSLFN